MCELQLMTAGFAAEAVSAPLRAFVLVCIYQSIYILCVCVCVCVRARARLGMSRYV